MAISPQLRELVDRATINYPVFGIRNEHGDERRKVIADLRDAAMIAAAACPKRARDFLLAAGFAAGYIGRDELEDELMGDDE